LSKDLLLTEKKKVVPRGMLAKKGETNISSFSQDQQDPTEYPIYRRDRDEDANPLSGSAWFVAVNLENTATRDLALRLKFGLVHAVTVSAAGVGTL